MTGSLSRDGAVINVELTGHRQRDGKPPGLGRKQAPSMVERALKQGWRNLTKEVRTPATGGSAEGPFGGFAQEGRTL